MSGKWHCRLFWGNPYTSPPHNMPRIALSVLCDLPYPIPDEIVRMSAPGTKYAPGTGWTIGWECIEQRPVRRWSTEAKGRVRHQNLRRRIEKRFPLFAEMFIADELARRPQYFRGEA
ncbi:hypothetical protein C8J27_1143 [Rhodobacter aestuarii]|uniref:Uncharacterized protein n=2 Tax=Rhodobacter aestuarii TaxID=453582 RepID=A0A1N7QCN9_9RHOB|nr:hypothetical protein [Rhodobacter aestuarii]PTV93557.1 hypothetical protein C8J27_1143 [Rhodobacter aestuarii]SIT20633.1 hypothetical protein SAMN05421580_1163 [Rhodobacter aestuarii]